MLWQRRATGVAVRKRMERAGIAYSGAITTKALPMISHLDHLVLTTSHEPDCIRFYTEVLGMQLESFIGGTPPVERRAFKFGSQKINLHVKGREFEPKAHTPVPGALDLCFISAIPLDQVVQRLQTMGVAILEGPVLRTGATGKIRSVYVRDPDLNLIEISEPAAA